MESRKENCTYLASQSPVGDPWQTCFLSDSQVWARGRIEQPQSHLPGDLCDQQVRVSAFEPKYIQLRVRDM